MPGQNLHKDEDDLLKKAQSGDANAQFRLAMQFDLDESWGLHNCRRWLEAAARQGHARACMQLCWLQLERSNDEEIAIKWYRRGRQLGHPHDLYFLNYWGPVTDKETKGLVQYEPLSGPELLEGAEAGDMWCQNVVAQCYAEGDCDFPVDLIRAFAWYATSQLQFEKEEGHIKIRNRKHLRSYLISISNTLWILDSIFNEEERAQAYDLVEELSPYPERQRGED